MKTLLTALMLSSTFLLSAQKIKVDETDKFTKQRRIETSKAVLRDGLKTTVRVHLRTVDTSCYLTMWGQGFAAGVVGETDAMTFLMDNDSTLTIFPTSMQTYQVSGSYGNYYEHQYRISQAQLATLAAHNVKSVRRYYNSHYDDMDVPEKNQDKLKDLSTLIIATMNNRLKT